MTQRNVRSSSRELRTLRRGALVVASLLLVFKGYPAWLQLVADERARTAELESTLELTRRVIATAASGDSAERALSDSLLVVEQTTFGGSGIAGATSDFADSVRATIDDSSVKTGALDVVIDSTGFRRGGKRPVYHLLRLRTDVASDIDGLTRFLEDLESSTPLLDLVVVNISTSDAFGAPGRAEQLRAEIVVRALVRPADLTVLRK